MQARGHTIFVYICGRYVGGTDCRGDVAYLGREDLSALWRKFLGVVQPLYDRVERQTNGTNGKGPRNGAPSYFIYADNNGVRTGKPLLFVHLI
jgi:hypothetical protein